MMDVDRVPTLGTVIAAVASLIPVAAIVSAVSRQTFPPVNAVDIGGLGVLSVVISTAIATVVAMILVALLRMDLPIKGRDSDD